MEDFSAKDLFDLSRAFPGNYAPQVAFAGNSVIGPVASAKTGISLST